MSVDGCYFENWNRYYEPFSGRYLQPEPILQRPLASVAFARSGSSLPAYAYAGNNPVGYVDKDGRCFAAAGVFATWLAELKNQNSPHYGKDKYAHCMANCQGTRNTAEIPCAILFDLGKELWDIYGKGRSVKDSIEDMQANSRGLSCEKPSADNCQKTCAPYLGLTPHFQ